MSEFKKELEKNMELRKIAYERENIDSYFVVSKCDTERIFHDWQPPKPLVVVPQFVADWFEKNEDDLSFKIWGYVINWKLQDKKSDFFRWMKKESECIEILIRMQDGYTVEKEKLYRLKNKITNQYINMNPYNGNCHESMVFGECYKCAFTQSEIDSMETGSYERIEVEP